MSHRHLLGRICGPAAAAAGHSTSGTTADRRCASTDDVQLAAFSQRPLRLRVCRVLSTLGLERRLHARLLCRSLHRPGKLRHHVTVSGKKCHFIFDYNSRIHRSIF